MKRNKTFFAVLLTLVAFAFFIFVVFMQQRFNNPEFTDLPPSQVEEETIGLEDDGDEEVDEDEATDQVAGAAGSVVNDELDEDIEEETEPTYSTRTVLVDTLNARSGPGVDYDITGVLVLDQVVEVEDAGNEWVRVITNDFTGYVNEKYLSEEE